MKIPLLTDCQSKDRTDDGDADGDEVGDREWAAEGDGARDSDLLGLAVEALETEREIDDDFDTEDVNETVFEVEADRDLLFVREPVRDGDTVACRCRRLAPGSPASAVPGEPD